MKVIPAKIKLTKADKTELRSIFKKTKLIDFLLSDSEYDYKDLLKEVDNSILFYLQKRLDDLSFTFSYVRCAMRYEKNFSYKENCLYNVFIDHFSDITLLGYFCLDEKFDFRFMLYEMLSKFRSFACDDIIKIITRITNLCDTIFSIRYNSYMRPSSPL